MHSNRSRRDFPRMTGSPVEDVVGCVCLISDHGAERAEGGLPELGERLHPAKVSVDDLEILKNHGSKKNEKRLALRKLYKHI